MGSQPVGIFTDKNRNRRDPSRNYPPPAFSAVLIASRCFQSRRMWRQPPPPDHSRQTQLIEVRRIVVRDSACQHKPLPRARRNLKSLQLANHFQRPVLAPNLRTRSNMLPAQKPVHEL